MTVRAVEGKQPYTGGTAIEIDENKVISLRLRDENNLIIYDAGDNEIYVDLQLPDELTPTDAFPVGITTGRVIVDNGWDLQGTLICAKTTSGDNIKLLYADEGTLWIDNGTGTFKQIYFKADVDGIITTLTTYINTELAKKQNGVTSATAPTDPAEGDLWYDTTSNTLKVYNGSSWVSTGGGGGGGGDIEYVTQAEYNALLPGAESDGKHYFIYTSSAPQPPFTPGADTLAYYKFDNNLNDGSGNGKTLTNSGTISYSSTPNCVNLSSSSYLYSALNYDFGTDWTINVWVNLNSLQVEPALIISNGTASNKGMLLCGVTSGSKLFYGFYNDDHTGTTNIALNTWTNLCFKYNYSLKSYKAYINGVQEISGTLYNQYSIQAGNMYIGAIANNASNPAYRVDGKLSEFIIECKERTAEETSAYFDATKGDYGIS